MPIYEYSVIPAPNRGAKAKDAKTPGDRFAAQMTEELNRMARDGWEFVRADVLPSEERSGLTGRTTVYHNLLVFRRSLAQPESAVTALQQESGHKASDKVAKTASADMTAPVAESMTPTASEADTSQAAAR